MTGQWHAQKCLPENHQIRTELRILHRVENLRILHRVENFAFFPDASILTHCYNQATMVSSEILDPFPEARKGGFQCRRTRA
jgi:hypothetical protein